nr:hypothetical protein [Tanacetum cinerariifolium]
TEYQLADLFTKALPKERFVYLVHRTAMYNSNIVGTSGKVNFLEIKRGLNSYSAIRRTSEKKLNKVKFIPYGLELITGTHATMAKTKMKVDLVKSSEVNKRRWRRARRRSYLSVGISCMLEVFFGGKCALLVAAFCLPDMFLVAFCSLRFVREKTLHFGSCVLVPAFCLLRFGSAIWSCVLLKDKLRLPKRQVAFCCKARWVLLQSSLRLASKLVVFFFKACCVFHQSSLCFASRHPAFCFNTSCVLSQDSCDLSHGCTAFCLLLKTLSAIW